MPVSAPAGRRTFPRRRRASHPGGTGGFPPPDEGYAECGASVISERRAQDDSSGAFFRSLYSRRQRVQG